MKKTLLTLIILGFFTLAYSQQRVALHHNDSTTIFTGSSPLVAAYNAAASGDTIYVPGGSFGMPSYFNKSLTIFGTGHYPDTTAATGKTILTGNLEIRNGADSLWLEGLEVTGSIYTSSNHKIDYITINRCRFSSLSIPGNLTTPCNYLTVRECVIDGSISFQNASYCLFTNNIVEGAFSSGTNNAIYNNVFLYDYYYGYLFNSITNCDVRNNISRNVGYTITGSLNTYSNNVFTLAYSGTNNTYNNNYVVNPLDSMFIDHTGNTFSYTSDFHLDSAGVYLGVDSTQVGIYGGLYPWKKSSIPNIPHIIYKKIPTAVEPNGSLDIEIKVNAEDY